jgi:acyl-CoA synthetase (AMP-forming)/AMP-acid ligase II
MDSLLMPLVVQGTPLLLVPAPLPDLLAEALSIAEPAIFCGVPYLFEMLARPDGPSFVRRGLRTCLSAGAPLRARTAAAFRERIGLPIRSFYGTSETGGITYDASPEGDAAAQGDGCVGTPLRGVEVMLEGDESRVVVRGPNVASGYIGPVDEGADAGFFDGLFRTGDTGRFDEQGRLYLTGRISGLVNVSGRKVNPREIERALLASSGILDAAVLSVADESRGEALVACLVAQDGVTREGVMAHLRRSLAPYKIPRRLVFLAELPRGARGKIDVEELRREALRAGDD